MSKSDLQETTFKLFMELSLRDKLIIYSKLTHPQTFRPQHKDLFGVTKRYVAKVYKDFIQKVREAC